MIFYFWAGKRADIHYGTGAISGFFSEDHVKIGDIVAKDQVCYINTYSVVLLCLFKRLPIMEMHILILKFF